MTEADWRACDDARPMLEFLQAQASARKLRLFVVACCRRAWSLLTDERSRISLDLAERLADGVLDEQQRKVAREAALAATMYSKNAAAAWAVQRSLERRIVDCLATPPESSKHPGGVPDAVVHAFGGEAVAAVWIPRPIGDYQEIDRTAREAKTKAEETERREQASLLRDIFGNPFRPVTLDPTWLAGNNATVVLLAQGIYDERVFDRLPILADALEDAGCTNQDILEHCRGGGEHVRGCWVVDLLLGMS